MSQTSLLQVQIEGMSCGHCVGLVQKAVRGVEGVRDAVVRVGRADVEAPASAADEVIRAIGRAGFDAALLTEPRSRPGEDKKGCGCCGGKA
tara:strand:- start:2662 stop:2934 length:273 start_codon:yes stop_codon:yes gene_type:complete